MTDRLRVAAASTPTPIDPPGQQPVPPRTAIAAPAPPVVRPDEQHPPSSVPSNAPSAPADSGNSVVPAGTLPALPGTAWKIDYGRGKTGDVFLFCSSGTWQIVPARGSIGAIGRSFRVSGATLTTVNRDDGQVQSWRMSAGNGVLIIDDGGQALTLHYNDTTQCR